MPYPLNAKHKTREMHKEPFAGLTMKGKEYEGTIQTPKSDATNARYWMSSQLPFDGMIRKKVDGEMTYIHYGTDGKPTLDWSGVKFDSRN